MLRAAGSRGSALLAAPLLLLAGIGHSASLPDVVGVPEAGAAAPGAGASVPAEPPFLQAKRVFMDERTMPRPARSGFLYPRFDARMHDGDEVQLKTVHTTWLTVSDDPSFTLRGRTMALKASNGMYCAVVLNDPEGKIRCDQGNPPFSAWFDVHEAPAASGNISIKGLRGGKFCVDKPEGMKCNRNSISGWEVFGIVSAGNGRIGLRGGRRGQFCADPGTGMLCNRPILEGDAVFEPVTDSPLAPSIIQTRDPDKAATFVVHRSDLDAPSIALRCKGHQRFLAVDEASGALSCFSDSPWMIAYARVTWWDIKSATFRAPETGLYFKAGDPKVDSQVRASSKDGSGWALWKVLLTGGYEYIRPLVRGVNLGNWFLIEKWMAGDLYYDMKGKDFDDECKALDEYGLMHALGPKAAASRMEKHWKTWITEEDIAWMASHGINAVRVPFGYWMVYPEPPFVHGQFKYLEALFRWCERHRISILLDFHGLKGSQTGNPTSGNCGACGHRECGNTHLRFLEEQKANLEVIHRLTDRFSASPAYLGFAVANEVSNSANSLETMAFYQRAYDIIRGRNRDALVVMFATFNPSTFPFPNFRDAVEDIHVYFGMGFGHPSLDQHENLQRAKNAIAGLHWNVLVGEWSLGANGHPTLSWDPARRDAFFAGFAKMQLQAWETHSIGWFYWSYKTRFPNSTWNFRDMCNVGWLPGCTSDFSYASTSWWESPSCSYAYLDGRCSAGPPSFAWLWWLLLLLMCAIPAAFYALQVLKPPWAQPVAPHLDAAHGAIASYVAAGSTLVTNAASQATAAMATVSTSASEYARPRLAGWQYLSLRPSTTDQTEQVCTVASPAPRASRNEGRVSRLSTGKGTGRGAGSNGRAPARRSNSQEQPFIW